MSSKQYELSIDHPALNLPKDCVNACLKQAIAKAISTGSNEGTVTLKLSFEIMETTDEITGEIIKIPSFKYKAQCSVPLKYSADGKLTEICRLIPDPKSGYRLVQNQVSMDELLAEEDPDGEE